MVERRSGVFIRSRPLKRRCAAHGEWAAHFVQHRGALIRSWLRLAFEGIGHSLQTFPADSNPGAAAWTVAALGMVGS